MLEWWMAIRYFFSKKSTNIINVISWVSVAGIAVGSMALIIVLSVFNGFESVVMSLENSFNPDILIKPTTGKVFILNEEQLKKLNAIQYIHAYSKVLEETALLKYGEKQYIATIKGVDENYAEVGGIDSMLVRGDFKLKDKAINFAVLGASIDVALESDIEKVYNPISVYIPKRNKKTTINPEESFNRELIYHGGTFAIQQEYDDKYVFVPISFARNLLNYTDEISAIEIGLKKNAEVKYIKNQLQQVFATDLFEIKTRKEQNEFLNKVIQTERLAVYVILTFILLIASFNMVGSLTMVVIDKTKDISILKTMGATNQMIKKIFLYNGLLISLIGVSIGFFIAFVLCILQQQFGFIQLQGSGTFVIDAYPVDMKIKDYLFVSLIVIGIGLTASWLPANRASQQIMSMKEE